MFGALPTVPPSVPTPGASGAPGGASGGSDGSTGSGVRPPPFLPQSPAMGLPSSVEVVQIDCLTNQDKKQKVDKWWLCDVGDIRPRDLSIVWPPSLQNVGTTLLVRGRAIIVYTLNIRAVVLHDRVLLFQSDDPSSAFTGFLKRHLKLTNPLPQSSPSRTPPSPNSSPSLHHHQMNLPFELDVVEAILMFETASLTERLMKLEPYVDEITKILPSHASQMNLEFMLKLNTELIQFEDDLAKLHTAINAILFSDRDLDFMNLTQRHEMDEKSKHHNRVGYFDDGGPYAAAVQKTERHPTGSSTSGGGTHNNANRGSSRLSTVEEDLVIDRTEVEILLENYAKCVDDLLTRVKFINRNMRNCEKMLEINLNSSRNRIMQTELRISVAALVLGGASVSAGFFGMNLDFPDWFATSPYAFHAVVSTTLLCSFAFGFSMLKWARYKRVLLPITAASHSMFKLPAGFVPRRVKNAVSTLFNPLTSSLATSSSPSSLPPLPPSSSSPTASSTPTIASSPSSSPAAASSPSTP